MHFAIPLRDHGFELLCQNDKKFSKEFNTSTSIIYVNLKKNLTPKALNILVEYFFPYLSLLNE